jgi:hypothetical protein
VAAVPARFCAALSILAMAVCAALSPFVPTLAAEEGKAEAKKEPEPPRSAPVNGLELSLSYERVISWRIKNVSAAPILVPGKFTPVFNTFVRDPAGKVHDLSTWGQACSVQNHGRLPVGVVVLPPGKSISGYIQMGDLSRRVSGDGKCSLWLELRADPMQLAPGVAIWSGSLSSNPAEFTVGKAPKDEKPKPPPEARPPDAKPPEVKPPPPPPPPPPDAGKPGPKDHVDDF